MDVLRIYLFGKFDVRCNGQTLNSFDARKVQELFCYLLLNRDRPHHRESLASLLWPKHTTAKSLKYLRNTLWQLQIALDASLAIENSNVLLIDPEWISLIPEAPLWLDVAEFERACALVQGKQGQKLDEQEIRVIQEALELYRGDLLEGWFQDWRLFEQERLRRMYLALLEKLIAHCEAHGEYQAGIDYTTRALRYDAAHERVHRRLMRLHYRAGNRTEALRQYKRCVVSLRQELGVGPSQRTVTLNEQIRADRPLDSSTAAPKSDVDAVPLRTKALYKPVRLDHSSPGAVTSSKTPKEMPMMLPQALHHLIQLQMELGQTQRQIQEIIQVVKMALNVQSGPPYPSTHLSQTLAQARH